MILWFGSIFVALAAAAPQDAAYHLATQRSVTSITPATRYIHAVDLQQVELAGWAIWLWEPQQAPTDRNSKAGQ